MSSKLRIFLNKYRVKNVAGTKKPYTHTGLGDYSGCYDIPQDQRPNFHQLIHETVFEKKVPVHITEKSYSVKPITIDLDFRYPQDFSSRQHNSEHIQELVQIYNNKIKEVVNVNDDKQLRAYVFEREGPYPFKGNIKDGIHIMYPHAPIDTNAQHIIRNETMKQIQSQVVANEKLGKLPVKNDIDDIVDKAVIDRNPWMMYGCSKPQRGRYNLTHVYDWVHDEYSDSYELREIQNHNYNHLELINLLSIQKPTNTTEKMEVNEDYKPRVAKFLEIDTKKETRRKVVDTRNYIINRRKTRKPTEDSQAKINEAHKLTNILSEYRAEDYKSWIELGMCLFNISEGLLETWIEFSKRSSKFKDGECEDKWSRFEQGNLGIGSLHRWAKLDDYDAYEELRSTLVTGLIFKSLSGTTQDIANVVYAMFKHQFVCVSAKGELWYEFKNHRWHECRQGLSLKQLLGNDVLNEYLKMVTFQNMTVINCTDDVEKGISLQRAKALTEISYKVRDIGVKEKIMRECVMFFRNDKFMSQLDRNQYLIGFENGVYDLEMDMFRDGRPEDCISLSTGIDYPDIEFDPEDELIQEIMEFFGQVFPDEELKEYVLILFSSFLQGTNPEELFHIFTGVGGNGKSKLIELFEMAMGEYTFKFPITLLTQKRASSGAANPEIARTKGRRFGIFQEPDEGERINVGLMKELTGGDSILCRALYAEPFEFKPQFKLVLCCNHLPKVPSDDKGTWRRLSVVEFKSQFVNNPDPTSKYEFARDKQLSQKLHRWKEMFLVILTHYYKQYKKMSLLEQPEIVKAATDEYRKDSDTYAQFKDDMFIRDDTTSTTVEEAYSKFKSWYTENIGGKPAIRREFKKNMERKLGVQYKTLGALRGWQGWRLFSEDDEADNQDLTQQICQLTESSRPSSNSKQVRYTKSSGQTKISITTKPKIKITPRRTPIVSK